MTSALCALLLASAVTSPLNGPAAELRYRGTLTPLARDASGDPVKRFEVYALATRAADRRELTHLVDEPDGAQWPWPERFGRLTLNGENAPTAGRRIQVLHDHDGTLNPLPLAVGFFEHTGKLEDGAEWQDGSTRYTVARKRKVGDYECWQVEVDAPPGRRQSLSVEMQTGLIVSAEQRVFMGRGDQFILESKLESLKPVDEAALQRLHPPIAQLVELQRSLEREENETDPELSARQLEKAQSAVDSIADTAKDTPFAQLVVDIARDVRAQSKRAGDVDMLAKRFVGQPAPKLELKSTDGKAVDAADHDGKIVVLHFWKYHDEPLSEPYGQVGYLDFLHSRRGKLGVQIYGVAVDPRLGNGATSVPALRQIRKLREFMNLSYPITIDDGALLKKFGDPQRTGANLPLWVAIAPDGRIVHYKVGYYAIKPDEGLRELDAVLVEEIRKQRAAKDGKGE